ncbi:MAG: ribonuclease HII [Eubacteriales bacterium]|nr:ribonuclease HII [Eubacteriales bacterium]
MSDLWVLEEEIYSEIRLASGKEVFLCGVDEAGRGPLAGPVCAAAVILPKNLEIPGLNDSKKLSGKKREELYDIISDSALTFGIAFASVEEIEEYNILNATYLAMSRAIEQLDPVPDLALIDGNRSAGISFPNRCIVKGDAKCADISAASVLAKVTRDRYMCDLAELYPQYGFDLHKGYGTAAHYAALREFGPSPVHRMSFLKKMH